MSGKGSGRRPRLVSKDKFSDNWDLIFKQKKAPEKEAAEISLELCDQRKQKKDRAKARRTHGSD
jgi:hypothetical protein